MLEYNGNRDKNYTLTCTECGAVYGDGVETCARCASNANRGHYGSNDVWGNWVCYTSCPACEAEMKR